jgi:hypothetical protein
MADERHKPHEYHREVSLSKETFDKYRKKKIKRFSLELVIAGWYKVGNQKALHREDGSFVDQLIFQHDNPHFKLQGYVFKG